MSILLLDATGGPTTQDVEPVERSRAEAQTKAAVVAGQVQQLTHQQQLQQPDIQQTCQSQRREPARVERRV